MQKINIVWLKRDLRVHDHEPLMKAQLSDFPCYVIYAFEPFIENAQDFDYRHWRFVWQSLKNLQQKIPLNIFYKNALDIFQEISEFVDIQNVFSHRETGLVHTFERDKTLKHFFKTKNIKWKESSWNAVQRGLENRGDWIRDWNTFMHSNQAQFKVGYNFKEMELEKLPEVLLKKLEDKNEKMLTGGEDIGKKLVFDFLDKKVNQYFFNISKPEKSRYFCSRISPYLAYGCISTKYVFQECLKKKDDPEINKKSLFQFMNRLRWQSHFIQKLEMQVDLDWKNVNSNFDQIRQTKDKNKLKAWKNGITGFPLIDAAMRCVKETGYLNFRLRATVTSFLTHHLWQPWKPGADYLAKMFLDYEPGIHYSQFQMQAGTTGINTLRIYNPVKQSLDKDPDATFLKKWLPELKDLPLRFIHQPWEMTEMEAIMYNFDYGKTYPYRIIDHEQAAKFARDTLWALKKSEETKKSNYSIVKKHVSKSKRRRPKK